MVEDTDIQYNYTLTSGFSTAGVPVWNVTCSSIGFETLSTSDNITVFSSPSIVFGAGGGKGASEIAKIQKYLGDVNEVEDLTLEQIAPTTKIIRQFNDFTKMIGSYVLPSNPLAGGVGVYAVSYFILNLFGIFSWLGRLFGNGPLL